MRILLLTPGTGHFLCGSCLRDSTLVKALRNLGHDAMLAPLYLPLFLEEAEPDERVHMGGVNMFLQQHVPGVGFLPHPLADLLDSPGLLRWVSRRSSLTAAPGLGAMTVSVLRGEEGRQAKGVEKLVDWARGLEPPDVVVLSNGMLIGVARRLAQALGRPILCTLQGEAPFLDALPEPHRSEAWETLTARSRDVAAFIPVSRHYGSLMGDRLGLPDDKVHVVHNGIDLELFSGHEDGPRGDGLPTIGYLARMCADKGLPTLIEAFIQLVGRGRLDGLRLRVAGVMLREDRSLVEGARGRLQESGCGARAEFKPNLERSQKARFLRSLSVLSVPATYGESFGLYLLESMACGVPVVQPRHGAFPEVLEATGGGALCEPDDPVSLADELEKLLLDEERRRALGEHGRRVVLERFGADRMARQVEEVCMMAARKGVPARS